MKLLVVLAALVAVAACWSVPSEEELASHWQAFKAAHAKNYPSAAEEAHRMSIFKENAIRVARHNARFDAGAVSFQVGINKYADMLSHEVAAMLNGLRTPKRGLHPVHNVSEPLAWPWPFRKAVDWRKKGYVTPVKDQGSCGAGWAFSTVLPQDVAQRVRLLAQHGESLAGLRHLLLVYKGRSSEEPQWHAARASVATLLLAVAGAARNVTDADIILGGALADDVVNELLGCMPRLETVRFWEASKDNVGALTALPN